MERVVSQLEILQPVVSVIVRVYRAEMYLKRCVESILAQSYNNIEIILVDDGSPDNCSIICDNFANLDSRIRVVHKANGGVSSARNTGMDLVRGEYLLFVDADDYISNNIYI